MIDKGNFQFRNDLSAVPQNHDGPDLPGFGIALEPAQILVPEAVRRPAVDALEPVAF